MMQNYAQICEVYDKKDDRDWGLKSSRVSGIYWNLYREYPLLIEFKNGDTYGYKVQEITDARGIPIGMECWHVLIQLLQYRNKKGQISIGTGINELLKCEYKKLDGVLL